MQLTKKRSDDKESLTDYYIVKGTDLVQADASINRLLFTSPILQVVVHISGLARVTIKVVSSKSAANLSVWLVSLPWNPKKKAKITDNIITRGWVDPQNHKSLTQSEALTSGKFYDVSFDLVLDDFF